MRKSLVFILLLFTTNIFGQLSCFENKEHPLPIVSEQARKLYEYLLSQGIIVRDRSSLELCEDSLRITVGTEQENTALVDAMYQWITNTFETNLN